VFKPNKKLD